MVKAHCLKEKVRVLEELPKDFRLAILADIEANGAFKDFIDLSSLKEDVLERLKDVNYRSSSSSSSSSSSGSSSRSSAANGGDA